jgi:hypothetical protein
MPIISATLEGKSKGIEDQGQPEEKVSSNTT